MQRKEEAHDLYFIARERLRSPDMGTFKSLLMDLKHNRIERSEFNTSVLLLFEKDEYLRHRFIQYTYGYNPQQDDQEDALSSVEDPNIEDHDLEIRVERDENRKEDRSHGDQKIEDHDLEIRVKINKKPKRRFKGKREVNTLLGKKTKKQIEIERVTPSYKRIPKGEETLDSEDEVLNCLNSKYVTVFPSGDDEWNHKKLSNHEQAMADCEEDMYEQNMLREALENALERAERVFKGTMRLEDLGVKFYRCINILYLHDMVEIVTQNHQEALPKIIRRLKQKLNQLTNAREKWEPVWKQVFKENTTKQRDSTAQGQNKK